MAVTHLHYGTSECFISRTVRLGAVSVQQKRVSVFLQGKRRAAVGVFLSLVRPLLLSTAFRPLSQSSGFLKNLLLSRSQDSSSPHLPESQESKFTSIIAECFQNNGVDSVLYSLAPYEGRGFLLRWMWTFSASFGAHRMLHSSCCLYCAS